MNGSGNVGKADETSKAAGAGGTGSVPVSGDGINWAKATLDDLRDAFIAAEGPEKGKKMFNQFQMMICQTAIAQMKTVEPKKHDDSQNQ